MPLLFSADALIVSRLPLTAGELLRAIGLRPISIRAHLGRMLLLDVRWVFVQRGALILRGGRTQVNAWGIGPMPRRLFTVVRLRPLTY